MNNQTMGDNKEATKETTAGHQLSFLLDSNKLFENTNRREWLSTEEAAHYLRLTPNALRIMVHRGQVVPHRVGRRLRFKEAELDALVMSTGG